MIVISAHFLNKLCILIYRETKSLASVDEILSKERDIYVKCEPTLRDKTIFVLRISSLMMKLKIAQLKSSLNIKKYTVKHSRKLEKGDIL